MAVESKPLFHPEVIRQHSRHFTFLGYTGSDTSFAEVKRIRGTKQPLTAAGLQALRQEYTTTNEPARILAAEALQLECRINDLVNQAYGLTPEEIDPTGNADFKLN